MAGGLRGMGAAPVDLASFEKIEEAFFAAARDSGTLFVVRTREDLSLDQARELLRSVGRPKPGFGKPKTKPQEDASETKTSGTLPYVAIPGAWLAKTDVKTFCIAEKEDLLKPLSDRLANKAGGRLDGQLQEILGRASGDHFFAVSDLKAMGAASGIAAGPAQLAGSTPQWVAFGLSADSSLTINGAAGFPNVADAETIRKQYDAAMSQIDAQTRQFDKVAAQMPSEVAKKARQQMEKAFSLLRAFRLAQSGDTIRFSGRWNVKDIEDLFADFAPMMPRRPF
jgi:hypothetical protein